jgi:hypothetical protein
MFERENTAEAPKSIEEKAIDDILLGFKELREITSNNEGKVVIERAREALFQRFAKAMDDIQHEGDVAGNTWPRPGDNYGGMNPDRFKPLQ